MDLERFGSSPVGHLVPISGYDARLGVHYDHMAFVPEPLPITIELPDETHARVSDAMLALGRLDQASERLPNPTLLVRPSIRREAVSTSALEGTYAAFSDVLEADFLEQAQLSKPVAEVHNFVLAAERGLELIRERPIARNLISELQAILVRGTRGDTYDAGRLREHQVVIGPEGCRVEDARFVPPPHGDVLVAGLDAWERWINSDSPVPLLVRVAAAHYQFETLHPFTDGNGRLGRLIALLQLIGTQALHHPILSISPWLERRRDIYQDHLAAVSATGNFAPWVTFFAEAVKTQATSGVRKIERLLTLKDEMVGTLRSQGVRSVAIPIAEDLIGYPVITPTVAAQQQGVSYQAANTAIARLVEVGIVKQVGERRYDRLFIAPKVVDALGDE